MAGYIIYNGFWNPTEPPDPVVRLQRAAAQRGVTLTALPNTVPVMILGESPTVLVQGQPLSKADFALCWDKDVLLAQTMEAVGLRIYNPSATIAACDNKAQTHLLLARHHVPMPETLPAPMTYRDMDSSLAESFCRTAEHRLGYPLVLKESYGSFGGQVYLIQDRKELASRMAAMGDKPFLAQRFIRSAAGRDVRLYVVGNRVIAAMKRTSQTDFRANIGNGGHGEAYQPTDEECRLALTCASLLKADFCGVDILADGDCPLVCEVNSNAFMAGIIACTGVDVAAAIIDYVLRTEKDRR